MLDEDNSFRGFDDVTCTHSIPFMAMVALIGWFGKVTRYRDKTPE